METTEQSQTYIRRIGYVLEIMCYTSTNMYTLLEIRVTKWPFTQIYFKSLCKLWNKEIKSSAIGTILKKFFKERTD